MPLAELSGPGLPPLLWWSSIALLGALLAMDEHSLAQTWFSQPLPACILAGLLAGDVGAGLAAGLLFQLAVIGNLPVGASFSIDSASAAAGVTAGAVTAGWRVADLSALWSAGPGLAMAQWGWILALMALASLLGGRLVRLEHRARLGWMLDGYRSVRKGDLGRIGKLHGRGLLATGLRGATLTVAWTAAALMTWPLGPERLPDTLVKALAFLPLLVPLLAAGSLLERYGHHQSVTLVAGVSAVTFLLIRFVF